MSDAIDTVRAAVQHLVRVVGADENSQVRADAWRSVVAALAVVEADQQRALEEAREKQRLHHTLLKAAWDELEAAEQHHRWHHEQDGREVEPREERLALLLQLSEALDDETIEPPFATASDVLAATLRFLADHHHRTIDGSRLHDPERIPDFADCPCLTCAKAAAALRLSERAALGREGEARPHAATVEQESEGHTLPPARHGAKATGEARAGATAGTIAENAPAVRPSAAGREGEARPTDLGASASGRADADPERAAAIAACPEPFWHDTHRYCPSCPWTEENMTTTFLAALNPLQVRELGDLRDRLKAAEDGDGVALLGEILVQCTAEYSEGDVAADLRKSLRASLVTNEKLIARLAALKDGLERLAAGTDSAGLPLRDVGDAQRTARASLNSAAKVLGSSPDFPKHTDVLSVRDEFERGRIPGLVPDDGDTKFCENGCGADEDNPVREDGFCQECHEGAAGLMGL